MDRQQIATRLVLKRLDTACCMDAFDDRLILQKVIYLAQAMGVQLGYRFQWYLRGPYCPVLARDAFSIVSELVGGDDESEQWRLEPESVARLAPLADRIQEMPEVQRARWLELLASIHFLVASGQADSSSPDLQGTLRAYKKDYSEGEVQRAIEQLKALCLLGEDGPSRR